MTEYNITAESKDTIKDFIKEYNQKILQACLKDYIAEEKPSIEDLVETLSNHVFLDRKPNGKIGIINDFIFGLLVGENLIAEKYQEYYPNFNKIIPQDFAKKSIQSFNIQCQERKDRLWKIYNENDFDYDVDFFFSIDFNYKRTFQREYKNLYLNDISFTNTNFDGVAKFVESGFSNVSFYGCKFNVDIFFACSFHNCNFYDCNFSITKSDKVYTDFGIFACKDNNDFVKNLTSKIGHAQVEEKEDLVQLTEMMVLKSFFQIDGIKPRARKISYIKANLSDYSPKEISKIISTLKSKEFLMFKDDIGFISKRGINYYNQNKTE